MPFFFIGFLIAAFTGVNLIGFGAIGVICAIFHIQSIAKESKVAVASGIDDIDDSDLM